MDELCKQVGIPVAMLQSSKGLEVSLELVNGERFMGTVVNVDSSANVELCNAKHWETPSAAPRTVQTTIVRGGSIMYYSLPQDELTAQFPMLKLVQRAEHRA